ncbi:MAG: DUF4249 domain-containing protein [Roseivirga sp.]|nr:DUF4249 domain-containing protein [Roseivirga sp.]
MHKGQRHRVKRNAVIGITLLFVALACSQVIDLETNETGGQVVIFGRVTNGTSFNQIAVARTGNLGQAPIPLSGAIVRIISENGQEQLMHELPREPGIYKPEQSDFKGTVGVGYRLEVEVLGQVYGTSLQVMPEVIGEDRLDWELVEEEDISETGTTTTDHVIKVYGQTSFRELPDEFYVRWGIEESYTVFGLVLPRSHFPRYTPEQCYIINDLSEQETFLLDGTKIRSLELGRQLFATRPIDRSFGVKHYFNLIHSAINKETYDYWSKINDLTTRVGSIFDTPPAPVPGNIKSNDPEEEVLGFFEVVSIDTARIFMTNNDIRVFWDDPCELNGEEWLPVFTVPFECVICLIEEKIVEETCVFCSKLPNSTLTRPSYF